MNNLLKYNTVDISQSKVSIIYFILYVVAAIENKAFVCSRLPLTYFFLYPQQTTL